MFLDYLNRYKKLLAAKELVNIYSILSVTSEWSNDYSSSAYYINKADSIVNNSNISGSGLLHYYIIRAYMYGSFKEYDRAQSILDSALVFSENQPGMLSQIYLRKYYIYKELGDIGNANKELSLHLQQEKKQLTKEKNIQTALLTIKYRLHETKMQIVKVRNRWLLIVIALLLVLILTIILFVNIKRKAYNEKRELQKLNSIVINEKRELVKNFESIKNAINNNRTNNSISPFENYRVAFILQYPEFVNKIRAMHPKLTSSDIKYCIAISCDLKNKEISEVLNVTNDAVRKAKRKLRNEFKLSDAEEVYEYLQQYKD